MHANNEDKQETEALLKLFNTLHLNVEERKSLPYGKVRATVVRRTIERALNTYAWFPAEKQMPIGDAGGEYIQIGLENNSINMHINYESSYLHYSHKIEQYNSIEEASNAFLAEKQRRNDLDGLEIDWEA